MIRINLLARRPLHPATALLVMSSALFVAAVILAGLYWVDQRYPLRGAWKELLADRAPGEAAGPRVPSQTDPVAATDGGGQPALSPGAAAPLSGAQTPPAAGSRARRTAPDVPARAPEQGEVLPTIDPGSVPGTRQPPRWSPAGYSSPPVIVPSGLYYYYYL